MFKLLKKFFEKLKIVSIDEVHYICQGSEKLKANPTQEEEIELAKKIAKGEETAKQELIERNLRLVVYTAQKFENTGVSTEDLISIGTIGLIKAVNSFNVDKNIKMATYASRCIENEILMHLRKTQKMKREVSFDEPLSSDSEGNELCVSDVLGTSADEISKDIESSIEKNVLHIALASLPEREQEIMNMRYGFGGDEEMTQKEVADKLSISQSYISRLEKKIISRLKKEIMKLA